MQITRRSFLRNVGAGSAALWLGQSLVGRVLAEAPIVRAGVLPRATPQSQGISPDAIHAFLDAVAASKHELHSFMLVRHGNVVAEGWWSPYAAELNHTMYSMSKSFTSTAVGFAVTDGKLSVEDKVTSFFPEDLSANVSEHLAALQVKHLLTMSVGNGKDTTGSITAEENWVRAFLALPIPNAPGSQFLYNSGATYMLSAIVQKVTGQKVIDYLRPRLFEPLGIEGTTWQTCPRGINTGGWGLSIRTEGLAKFGQTYLQRGRFNDKQVVPQKWVEQATTFKIQQPIPTAGPRASKDSDWTQGYCYQFWRCTHNAFRGDGAFGQFTVVMPEQDAVMIMTGESSDLQGELEMLWKHIFPALKDSPLPDDAGATARLKERLSSLALKPPTAGNLNSPRESKISGKTFTMDANDLGIKSVSLTFGDAGCAFTAIDAAGDHTIQCGPELWAMSEANVPGTPPSLGFVKMPTPAPKSKIAASGTWKDENTYEMTWRYYETPHHDTVICAFDGDALTVKFSSSIAGTNPAKKDGRKALQGKIAV